MSARPPEAASPGSQPPGVPAEAAAAAPAEAAGPAAHLPAAAGDAAATTSPTATPHGAPPASPPEGASWGHKQHPLLLVKSYEGAAGGLWYDTWLAVVRPAPGGDPTAAVWAGADAADCVEALAAAAARCPGARPAAWFIRDLLLLHRTDALPPAGEAAAGAPPWPAASAAPAGCPPPPPLFSRTALHTFNARAGGALGQEALWGTNLEGDHAPDNALLNDASPVHALLLTHFFEGALPDGGGTLTVSTVLFARDEGGEPAALRLAAHALAEHSPADWAPVLRSPRLVTVLLGASPGGGVALSATEIAAMAPAARAALDAARLAQVVGALAACARARWAGGVLLLQPTAGAAMEAAGDAEGAGAARRLAAALLAAIGGDGDGSGGGGGRAAAAGEPAPLVPLPSCAACAACGAAPAAGGARLRLCGRCRSAAYCGRACQDAAWPAHRAACVPTRRPGMAQFRVDVFLLTPQRGCGVFVAEGTGAGDGIVGTMGLFGPATELAGVGVCLVSDTLNR